MSRVTVQERSDRLRICQSPRRQETYGEEESSVEESVSLDQNNLTLIQICWELLPLFDLHGQIYTLHPLILLKNFSCHHNSFGGSRYDSN